MARGRSKARVWTEPYGPGPSWIDHAVCGLLVIVWFNRKTPIQTPLGAIRNFDGLARSRPNPGQIGEIQKHHFSYDRLRYATLR